MRPLANRVTGCGSAPGGRCSVSPDRQRLRVGLHRGQLIYTALAGPGAGRARLLIDGIAIALGGGGLVGVMRQRPSRAQRIGQSDPDT